MFQFTSSKAAASRAELGFGVWEFFGVWSLVFGVFILVFGSRSSPRDNLHDFQAVAGVELALGEFRRRDRGAIVLHHDAARQQTLREQKFLDGARQPGRDRLSVGDDEGLVHGNRLDRFRHLRHAVSAASQSFHTGS